MKLSFSPGSMGYNCPRSGYHWFCVPFIWPSDLHKSYSPLLQSSPLKKLPISIPSPLSCEEELIAPEWPDICMWLCKYKVFGVNVAVWDWWWVLKCAQALKQEMFVTAHLAKHWQDPCRPSVCDSGSSPCCKWGSASSIVFSLLALVLYLGAWIKLNLVLAHSAGATLPPQSQKDKRTSRFLLY